MRAGPGRGGRAPVQGERALGWATGGRNPTIRSGAKSRRSLAAKPLGWLRSAPEALGGKGGGEGLKGVLSHLSGLGEHAQGCAGWLRQGVAAGGDESAPVGHKDDGERDESPHDDRHQHAVENRPPPHRLGSISGSISKLGLP